jgi:hypothetical protein
LVPVLLVLAAVYIGLGAPRVDGSRCVQTWIIDANGRICFGPAPESVDPVHWKYVARCAAGANRRHTPRAAGMQVIRRATCHEFQRVAAFPLRRGLAFVMLWRDRLPDSCAPSFNCTFSSPTQRLLESPRLTFSSLRDLRPVHIAFTLDTNVRMVADLPGSILASFQPYGQNVSITLAVFEVLTTAIANDPCHSETLGHLVDRCCQKIGITRAFCFQDASTLLYQFGEPVVPRDTVMSIPGQFPIEHGMTYVDNFLQDGDRYFLARFPAPEFDFMVALRMSFGGDEDSSEAIGSPFVALCALLVFQLGYARGQAEKTDHIRGMFDELPTYSFAEISNGARRIIRMKSQLFGASPTNYDEFLDAMARVSIDFETLVAEVRALADRDGRTVAQRVIRVPSGFSAVISVVASYDSFLKDGIVSILLETIPADKQEEFEKASGLDGLQQAMKSLNMHPFHIVDGDVVMDSVELASELRVADRGRLLKDYFYPNDASKYNDLLRQNKVTFRLQSRKAGIWYSALSNGQIGYLFSIHNLPAISNRIPTDDERMQIAASTSILIFWVVDPRTHMVHSLFMQPTVWDTLSVDRDASFLRFADYIDCDDRDEFSSNYAKLLRCEIQQWTSEIRVFRMGGHYEWHRIVIAKSRSGMFHCVALNIHKQREMENKLNETRKLRDLLLSSGKLAIWRFNDDHKQAERMHNFDPGIMTVVVMNWQFIDEQVHPDYRDEFRMRIGRALASDSESLEMDLPVLLDNEIWFSIRDLKSRVLFELFTGALLFEERGLQ